MLDHLVTVARIAPDTPAQILHGAQPAEFSLDALRTMCEARTTVRKEGGHLAVMVPVADQAWIMWVFDKIPAVTALPDLLKTLGGLSHGFAAPAASAPATPAAPSDALSMLLGRFSGAGRLRRAGVLQTLADGAVEGGMGAAAAVFPVTAKAIKSIAASDQKLMPLADELRGLARARRRDAPVSEVLSADDQSDRGLDAALLLQNAGYKTLHIDLPPVGQAGFGAVIFDPTPQAQPTALCDLASVALSKGKASSARQRLRRAALAAVMLLLLAVLLLPAPMYLTLTAISRPATGVSAALHFDAFISRMAVEVGDTVQQGDLIAQFTSPDLEERKAEVELQLAVEEVTAQGALSQNDYGAFVLAEQRVATNKRRLDNINARIDTLALTAPVSGTVVAAMNRGTIGEYVPTGQRVAMIQPQDRFALTLTVLRVDAPLIQPGQTGEVYFRGISGTSFPFTVQTPVTVERHPETGEERLTAQALVEAPVQNRLMAGLSGYARLQAGRQPRILTYTRYAAEYLKVKAWTYLGLRF